MTRWFVSIDHLTDDQLMVLGYFLLEENNEFKIYRHYSGDEHIVCKNGPKFMYVDDINDAIAMQADRIISFSLTENEDE